MRFWWLGIDRILPDRDWKALKMLLPFAFEFKYRFAFCFVCLALIKAIGFLIPHLQGSFLDELNNPPGLDMWVFLTLPVAMLVAYVFCTFSSVAFAELQTAVFGTVTVRATRRLSLKLLNHLHTLDLDYHVSRKTGGLTRDMDRGIYALTGLIRLFSFTLIGMGISIVGVIAIFGTFFDWTYAGIVFVAAVFYAVYTVKITAWRTPFIRESNEAHSRAHTRAVDSLINYENVKFFGNEEAESTLYDAELQHWERARAKNRYSLMALNIGQSFLVSLGLLAMMTLAFMGLWKGEFTIGDMARILGYATMAFGPLGTLGGIYRQLKQAFTDVERMLDILEMQPKVVDASTAKALPNGNGPIVFNDVSFHYRENRPILHNVSFTIEAGEKVALVGPSGGGKSTIARLLFRFYDACEGSILVNGSDIREVTLDSLRATMGVVPQETTLFNDTLFQNIQYGAIDSSSQEVIEATRMAHLHGMVSQLPEGYETIVGERGLKLSGGEKQRVAIARTMLKRPTFLIFDEATSSLDSATEASVMQAIRDVSEGHTTLVIAHRLSTVIDADRILVLVDGRIRESGSHHELLNHGGVYERLWRLQHRQIRLSELDEALAAS